MKYYHVAISVRNLENSLRFYREIFGFTEVKRFEREDLKIKAVSLKLNSKNDLCLELIQSQKPLKNKDDFSNLHILGIKHICFEINDVDKKYKELKNKGYEVTKLKKGKTIKQYFFIKDPDGLVMELCEK